MAIDYNALQARVGVMLCKINLLTGEEFFVNLGGGMTVDFSAPGPWRYELRIFRGANTNPNAFVDIGIGIWDGASFSNSAQLVTMAVWNFKR